MPRRGSACRAPASHFYYGFRRTLAQDLLQFESGEQTMRALLLTVLCGACLTSGVSASAAAGDDEDVRATVRTFERGWNSHDMDVLFQAFTPDADWVNVVGMWWQGLADVKRAHRVYHETLFKDTPLRIEAMRVRFVTADTAIAVVRWKKGSFLPPDGRRRPEGSDLMSLFLVKQAGRWLIAHGHNTTIDEGARKDNPVQ
jgi:uncharacterized protein (TIGR02246 family)